MVCISCKEEIITMRVIKHRNRWSRVVADATSRGNISGQIGWGSEQAEDVPSHSRGADDLKRSLPTQSII